MLFGIRKIEEKNNNKLHDPRGEDKMEKQHKLRMNIRNVYISVRNTNVCRIENTLE